jgi:hypothetical protein
MPREKRIGVNEKDVRSVFESKRGERNNGHPPATIDLQRPRLNWAGANLVGADEGLRALNSITQACSGRKPHKTRFRR